MPGLIKRIYPPPAVLGVAAVLATGTAAKAQSAFDGLWSVQIVAQAGACGSGYVTYPVRIMRGVVEYAGNLSVAIAGQVNRRGDVRFSLASGADRANATGRLSKTSGSGQWDSPTRGCSGHWTAARQG